MTDNETAISHSDYFDILDNEPSLVLQPKKEAELLIYNPGLTHIATCRSAISYLDGTDGTLCYRGKPIEQVVTKEDFLRVSYDLLGGRQLDLEYSDFAATAHKSLVLFPDVHDVIMSMPLSSHPMDMLAAGLLAASGCSGELQIDESLIGHHAAFTIAQTHICASLIHRRLRGEIWEEPDDGNKDYIRRVLNRLVGPETDQADTRAAILNQVLILHAEHDQNCSTSTVRNIASAGGDLISAVSAGIAAFKAPLHGGASEQVPIMLEEIARSGMATRDYVERKIQNRERLMGFGHRVYNCWDPRARFMYELLIDQENRFDEIHALRQTVLELIETAGHLPFFKERAIFPNPDLFNGTLFRWIGVPREMNVVMLSMSRIAGWAAHFAEQMNDRLPLVRPRQLQKSS